MENFIFYAVWIYLRKLIQKDGAFWENSKRLSTVNCFNKNFILHIWSGFECISELGCFFQKNTDRKTLKKIFQSYLFCLWKIKCRLRTTILCKEFLRSKSIVASTGCQFEGNNTFESEVLLYFHETSFYIAFFEIYFSKLLFPVISFDFSTHHNKLFEEWG